MTIYLVLMNECFPVILYTIIIITILFYYYKLVFGYKQQQKNIIAIVYVANV